MTNPNYISGRAREYAIKAYLEGLGFQVFRTAGSHTSFDLIAMQGDRILFIQSKKGMKATAKLQIILLKLMKPRYVFVKPLVVGDAYKQQLDAELKLEYD